MFKTPLEFMHSVAKCLKFCAPPECMHSVLRIHEGDEHAQNIIRQLSIDSKAMQDFRLIQEMLKF